MRLQLSIDSMYHEIDSTDPETLGRWIVEIFGRVRNPSPSTFYQVRAIPSWVPDESGQGKADWIQDTRWLEMLSPRSPRELVNQLSAVLDKYEARDKAND